MSEAAAAHSRVRDENMVRLTLERVQDITSARLLLGEPRRLRTQVRDVCTDSRTLHAGDLFIALKGERFDGHRFVPQALEKSAAGVLVEAGFRVPTELKPRGSAGKASAPSGGVVLAVPDSLVAYQQLAAYHRSGFEIPVVAVTGSNGKTTTKEMIARVLEERWNVLVTEGNLNNQIGVPQTLLRLRATHEAAVIEMGVDQKGQTTRLAGIVRPTIGVITNIGPDHLEFFGTMDASAEAKGELLDVLPTRHAAVLNADDPYFGYLNSKARCRVVSFGLGPLADVRALEPAPGPDGIKFGLMLPGRARPSLVVLPAHGFHNLSNALAAAAVGYLCGVTGAKIAEGLARFRPAIMRSQVESLGAFRIINDCYNANPASMNAAIDLLAALGGPRTIAVLGDMLELGPRSSDFHREVGAHAASRRISVLVACGALGKGFAEGARGAGMNAGSVIEAPDALHAARLMRSMLRPGDVVLIKGSRGMRMEQVVDMLKNRLPPAEKGAGGRTRKGTAH
jgi:UDP-N-acetylmuramoyl-tripeptide--D-alanyl-D-alanine ligase